ncbi:MULTISPECIES: ArsR/SmtB family transcription factor [Paenibacillus]|jgi:DNA-binding transcriptional ArsR family regulator|uniref:ArsR/SmtB family transcription factor n=1 Tax=Paenibacillus TaxID=44249 RepID=UPI0004F5CF03|nr:MULTISPECIES: winged helix-turn-helix domain-containing protein [unclassified Paenibacillus]AIQ30743.1 ArsR family transcriptional regulator [Paenibacillus sp. FSL P4-0081]OMF30315.1 transcriptional regulator [Paenibacillus sp. FSL H8-0259]
MDYEVEVHFQPVYELISSIHTFICKKGSKKIDLGTPWAAEVSRGLSPELLEALEETDLDNDWKLLNLLIYLCPDKDSVERVLEWLEGLSVGEMYEALAGYVSVFPVQMEQYRSRMVFLLSEWNRQYFSSCSPDIIKKLQQHAEERRQALAGSPVADFVNKTTNGFYFMPGDGLRRLVLIPQFHFQPINIIYNFGPLTICHYAGKIQIAEEEIPPSMHRTLRSLGEKSRLKILKSLGGERKSFTEIARQAGLSKGIVHDHISSLRSAGLLNAYIEGENVTSYSLRLEGIQQMNEQLFAYLK